ncbi:MAG: hypothetical protein ACRBCT_06670 [Alphaproteobacteria bacterium]
MTAVSCSSGGVMFIPDEIETNAKTVSYKEFVKEECAKLKQRKLFGNKDTKPTAKERKTA